MNETNDSIMSHKRYLELLASGEPMSIGMAKMFLEHPNKCDECRKEAKKQKQKKN